MVDPAAFDKISRRASVALTDLARWDLSAAGWEAVAHVLGQMDGALTGDEPEALADLLTELEILSPVRAVGRLGEHRAPRPVQLVANRLVHRLGQQAAPPALRLPFLIGPPPPRTTSVADQELIVHRIAAADGEAAAQAYRQLRRCWLRCRHRLAMTYPVAGLDLPTELPADAADLPTTAPIAAITTEDTRTQAVLWREHDVLVLSVLLGPPAGGTADTWADQDERWDLAAAGDSDLLMGSSRLYLGLAPAEAGTDLGFRQDPGRTAHLSGGTVIDLAEEDDPHAERRLIVLGSPSDPDRLSTLSWSPTPHSAPLARYLVNAAKLRYQARLRQALGESIAVGDQSAADITGLITDLDDVRTTVTVARRNMTKLLGPAAADGFAADDQEIGDWLQDQLDADLAYLRHEQTRRAIAPTSPPTRSLAPAAAPPTIAIVTAMAEERAAALLLLDDAEPDWVPDDPAGYTVGTLPSADPTAPHRVVVCQLGGTATASAAESVAHLIRSYPSVDQVIMTGIAAGVPAPDDPARHVRLGDVLVATYGIVAYDHIVDRAAGSEQRAGFPRPSVLLSRRAERLRGDALLGVRPWETLIEQASRTIPGFARPDAAADLLHVGDSDTLAPHPDPARSGHRAGQPKIHHGRIGSGDRSLRHAANRDELARRHGIIGIEMEGAGVGTAAFATGRSWFVVRGVSDYADRHVNADWRNYASLAAAAYVRALLIVCPTITPHVVEARSR